MKFTIPLLIFSLFQLALQAQEASHIVYFQLDQSDLSNSENEKLQVWLSQFDDTLKRIEVNGYTDFLASEEYNLALSKKRAEAVLAKIEARSEVNYRMSLVSGKGEKFSVSNESSSGIPSDRKVEVIIYQQEPIVDSVPKTSKQAPIAEHLPESEYDLIESASVGQTIVLKNLNFFPGRHFLIPQALPELERLTQILLRNPNMEIEIQGHICCKLDSIDAMDVNTRTYSLSYNRAEYIHDQLVLAGIDSKRMKYRGFAGSRPLYNPELTAEHRNKNRRVEIKILKK